MFEFVTKYINNIFIAIGGIFLAYICRKNLKLNIDNAALKQNTESKDKVISIQNKVINASKDNTNVSINDNIKRMRSNDL